jgi:ribosomal protein S18 acetylase RimI-like enzyme
MDIRQLRERDRIEAWLRRDPGLHFLSIADLDDFFWPQTRWYGAFDGTALRAICLLFQGLDPPVVVALGPPDDRTLALLVMEIRAELPRSFYAHLAPGLAEALATAFQVESHGEHRKMVLPRQVSLQEPSAEGLVPLTDADLPELLHLQREANPDQVAGATALEPYMLASGQYFGIREDGQLVSAGGVHLHSPPYDVAVLGNIATRPSHRGRGLARAVTLRICQSLRRTVSTIGLNVKADNVAALRCYRRAGFELSGSYIEATLERRG